ncbi:MAG: DUF1674 domain-containing protein [Alphaproteobacteria bacterium]|nr:DUF1674 domain-containing protein [Alphaproteobacteria bacterium]
MTEKPSSLKNNPPPAAKDAEGKPAPVIAGETGPKEVGGQKGPEPTRYGDWEKGGRCTDF